MWNRSVKQLGDQTLENRLEETLKKLYPQDSYPFHIEVVRGFGAIAVSIWIRGGAVKPRREIADPAEFVTDPQGPTFAAVISKLMEMIPVKAT